VKAGRGRDLLMSSLRLLCVAVLTMPRATCILRTRHQGNRRVVVRESGGTAALERVLHRGTSWEEDDDECIRWQDS